MRGKTALGAALRGRLEALERLARESRWHGGEALYPPLIAWRPKTASRIRRAWRRALEASPASGIGLYVHVPFCSPRCPYCRRATPARQSFSDFDAYLDCLKRELEALEIPGGVRLRSLYLGGGVSAIGVGDSRVGVGAPTVLSARQLEGFLSALRGRFSFDPRAAGLAEICPFTVTPDKIGLLRSFGIGRADMAVRPRCARGAPGFEAERRRIRSVVDELRRQGMELVRADLMVGLPGQTIAQFLENLKFALELKPDWLDYQEFFANQYTPQASADRGQDNLRESGHELMARLVRAAMAKLNPRIPETGSENSFQLFDSMRYASSVLGLGFAAYSHAAGEMLYGAGGDFFRDYLSPLGRGRPPRYLGSELSREREMRMHLIVELEQGGRVEKERFRRLFGAGPAAAFGSEIRALERAGLIAGDRGCIRLTGRGERARRLVPKLFYEKGFWDSSTAPRHALPAAK